MTEGMQTTQSGTQGPPPTETASNAVPDLDMSRFAMALKLARSMGGKLTIADVAERTGVSQATISRAEQGRVIELPLFVALVRWMGLSADELLGIKPNLP